MTTAVPPLPVLIVDDDIELGAMLGEYLSGEGFQATAVHNGEDGARAAVSGAYRAVVLDVMLPVIDGFEVLRRIRQSSQVPVIMLTAKGDNVDRVVGLELGADDYLPKPVYSRELVARLRAVLRRTEASPGPARQSPQALVLAELTVSPPHRRATWRDQPIDLTVSEFNLLELLLRAEGAVVTKDELSRGALARPHQAYDRSVDVHIGNLRQKLSLVVDGQVEIQTVRGIGYAIGPGA